MGAVTNLRSGRFRVNVLAFWLLADTEFADDVAVAIGIVRLQVVQKAAALADQLQKAAPGSVVLLVRLEVFGQFADARTQNRDLDLRRAGVRIMGAEAFNQGCFLCGRQHGVCDSSCLLRSTLQCLKRDYHERAPRVMRPAQPEPKCKPAPSPRPKTEEPIVEALADYLGDFDFLRVGMLRVQQVVPGLRGYGRRDARKWRFPQGQPGIAHAPG